MKALLVLGGTLCLLLGACAESESSLQAPKEAPLDTLAAVVNSTSPVEEPDTVPINESLGLDYTFLELVEDLLLYGRHDSMIANLEAGTKLLDQLGYEYSAQESPEEGLINLWCVRESADESRHLELLYQYQIDGRFYGFRHIVSELPDNERKALVAALKEGVALQQKIEPRRFIRHLDNGDKLDEGWLWDLSEESFSRHLIISMDDHEPYNWIELQQQDHYLVRTENLLSHPEK